MMVRNRHTISNETATRVATPHHGEPKEYKRKRRRRKNGRAVWLLGSALTACLYGVLILQQFAQIREQPRNLVESNNHHVRYVAELEPHSNNVVVDDANNNNNDNNNELKGVWLMSFPNSGTSYTSRLVRDFSQTNTATNYGEEFDHPISIFQHRNESSGPFWVVQDSYAYPTNYVLIKTHCGLKCAYCPPEQYHETTYTFKHRCAKTLSKLTHGHYYNIHKAVHLFRDPFDNVVSRFHLERTRGDRTAKNFENSKLGFLKYCLSIDNAHAKSEIKYAAFGEYKVLQNLWMVPCHADFVRYVEWHNLAYYTTHDMNSMPVLTIRYEDYQFHLKNITQQLSDFLELPIVGAIPEFTFKAYNYYSQAEREIVKKAFQFMASRETWAVVKNYF